MKYTIFGILFIFLINSKSICQSLSQTQLTEKYSLIAHSAEKKLDSVYNSILQFYSSDTLFTNNLKKAQKAWSKYVALQAQAMFPPYPTNRYGSMGSMCYSKYVAGLIRARITELEPWLSGRQDGDCGSSIKPIDELPTKN
jgi:uncharacterized protein YecT (DUF1311 family)